MSVVQTKAHGVLAVSLSLSLYPSLVHARFTQRNTKILVVSPLSESTARLPSDIVTVSAPRMPGN